jgi:hypothetical protein
MKPIPKDMLALSEAIHDKSPVSGLTHAYYRYPARFSPSFVCAAIQLFTESGDIVYDPFMGGGTTLVETMSLGRKGIGTDLNSLAVFISRVKTAILSDEDISVLCEWVEQAQSRLKLTRVPRRPIDWITQGYQRNISGRTTWPIRKTIEIALARIGSLSSEKQRDFVRCLLLRTTQWAVDCRKHHPSASDLRQQMQTYGEEMITGALELREQVGQRRTGPSRNSIMAPLCLHLSAKDIALPHRYPFSSAPKLILTSPPYPGVHVLYHRWQIHGRKETPAPYWIANCLDGNGASFYTFGDRKKKTLENYFENMRESYGALAAISDENTWLVQLVAFSAPEWQLPLFLGILQECGFDEVQSNDLPTTIDGRAWRTVPNRKFYADSKGKTPSCNEVLLIHRAV